MKVAKNLKPIQFKNFAGTSHINDTAYLEKLGQSILLLNNCVGELASTVKKIISSNAEKQQSKNNSQLRSQPSRLIELSQSKPVREHFSGNETGGIKQNFQEYWIEPRFKTIEIPLPKKQQGDERLSRKILKNWAGRACKTIFSIGFRMLQSEELDLNKVKVYCSENFLRNILTLSQQFKLDPHDFQIINKCLKNQLLPYFLLKYPQTEQRDTSKKFSQMLIERDISAQNDFDLVYKSGIKFSFEPYGNYNSQIMQFLNYIITIPNEIIQENQQEQKFNNNQTLYQNFVNDVQSIFKMVQSETSKINMLKFNTNNINSHKNQANISSKVIKETVQKQIKSKESYESQGVTEQRRQKLEQQYKQKVKSYTSYQIGSKLSLNFSQFSEYEIRTGNLNLSSTTIMRVVTKWCEELEKCFDPKFILNRENPFRMKDGSEKFLTKLQMEVLNLMLQREKEKIKSQLQKIEKNSYEQQSLFAGKKVEGQLQHFTEQEGKVGQFISALFKVNENYLINYLNMLIHGINNAAQCYGRFRDYQTFFDSRQEATQNIERFFYQSYNQQTLVSLQKQIYMYPLSTQNAIPQTPQLITFKIGDLLRCKCTSKEDEILALYKQIERVNLYHPQLLKIIRIKNRLSMGNKDILINLLYRDKIIVEMQLAIKSEKSKFIECSNNFNHYLYELKRSQFGPIIQMCSIWVSLDLRAQFYLEKLSESRKRTHNNSKADQQICCLKKQNSKILRLPFTCSTCSCFYHHCNFSQKHIYCDKCQKSTCFLCQIQTFPSETKTKLLPQLLDNQSFNLNQAQFLKQVPQRGGAMINLKSKNRNLIIFNTVEYNEEFYLFQSSKKEEQEQIPHKNLIYKCKSKTIPFKFINENLIMSTPQVQKILPIFTTKMAETCVFVPEYLKNCYRTQNKSIMLMEKQLDSQIFDNTIKNDHKLQSKVWKSVDRLNLSQNNFFQLGILPQIFPGVLSLVLNENKFTEFGSGAQNWKNLKELYLSNNKIEDLSAIIEYFPNLSLLDVSTNILTNLPSSINKLIFLEHLNIMENQISEFNENFYQLQKMKTLNINANKFNKLGDLFGQLKSLKEFQMNKNQITQLPSNFANLSSLGKLTIVANQITSLPSNIGNLQNLVAFESGQNNITDIPQSFGQLKYLASFHCNSTHISTLPQTFGKLESLTQIYLSFTKINKLPDSFCNLRCLQTLSLRSAVQLQSLPLQFGNLKSLKTLKINQSGLQYLPQSFGNLSNLRQLIMNSTSITSLPTSFGKLRSLTRLSAKNCQLLDLPLNFSQLQQLTTLELDGTKVTSLPPTFCNLRSLATLSLNFTQILNLPSDIGNLENLRHFFISGCNIQEIPESFGNLSSLQKLDTTQMLKLKTTYQFLANMQKLEDLKVYMQCLKEDSIPLNKLKNLKILNIQYGKIEAEQVQQKLQLICLQKLITFSYQLKQDPDPTNQQ